MGNKLDATRIALSQGFTGVSDPTATLDAITKGMEGVATWKKGIDDADIKLKTDTAEKYREAEKKVYEDLPTNETYKAQILKGLDSYKNRLYDNMKMVQKGVINPNDNLIFQENGKQSFNILSERVNKYSSDREAYIKSVTGYTNEKGEFIKPTTGKGGAALEDLNSQMGNPEFTKITFGQDGMARITFYETKINQGTSTRELVKDKDGNPMPLKGLTNVSVLAYEGQRNQGAGLPRVYLDEQAKKLTGKDSAFQRSYQTMVNSGIFVGNIVDDIRNKDSKQLKKLLDDAANVMSATAGQSLSILSDNGPDAEQSTPLNDRQWTELSNTKDENGNSIDMNAKVKYDYYDFDSGEIKQGEKSKYIKMTFSKNNTNVPILTPEDKLAAERIAQFSIYSSLDSKIARGIEDPENARKFAKSEAEKDRQLRRQLAKTDKEKKEVQTVSLIDDVVQGKPGSFEALLRSGGFTSVKDNDTNTVQLFNPDGTKKGQPIDFSRAKLDVGTSLAAEFIGNADIYRNENNLGEPNTTANKEGIISFGGPRDVTLNLDTKVEGKGEKATTYSQAITQVVNKADDDSSFGINKKMLASGIKTTIQKALLKSNQKISNLEVKSDNKTITITGINQQGNPILVNKKIDTDDRVELLQYVEELSTDFFTKVNDKPSVSEQRDAFGNIIKQ